jgi:hypothetical protein
MRARIWALTLSLLAMAACDKKNQENQPEELAFTVRQELLAATIVDSSLGFSWAPPQGWQPLPTEKRDWVAATLQKKQNPQDPLTARPVYIFIDREKQLFCTVSQFQRIEMNDSLIARVQESIVDKFAQAEIRQGVFRLHGLTVHQSRIVTGGWIIYKFFVTQPRLTSYLIDYIIPHADYEKNLQSIESSIGSLQPLSL